MSLLLVGLAGDRSACWQADDHLRASGCYVPLICREEVLRSARMAAAAVGGRGRGLWDVGVVQVTCEANAVWVRANGGRVIHFDPRLGDGVAAAVGAGDVVLSGGGEALMRKLDDVLADLTREGR